MPRPDGSGSFPSAAGGQPLAGRRVLLTRTPERSTGTTAALRGAGADVLLLPLIDFAYPADTTELEHALARALEGAFDWLVLASPTALRSIGGVLERNGNTLQAFFAAVPDVAAVGPQTQRILHGLGVRVSLLPTGEQSAAGLLTSWTQAGARIFLPQADLSGTALAAGLRAAGNDVTALTAYRTVDYPAQPSLKLPPLPGDGVDAGNAGSAADCGQVQASGTAAVGQLSLETARAGLTAGTLDAVVAASPSAARRISATLAPLTGCRLICIGPSTAAAARSLGLDVAATASEPTPAGILAATIEAFSATKETP